MEMEKKMRKTKIICTLGPSTDNDEIIREMICLGMDVAIKIRSLAYEKKRLYQLG